MKSTSELILQRGTQTKALPSGHIYTDAALSWILNMSVTLTVIKKK